MFLLDESEKLSTAVLSFCVPLYHFQVPSQKACFLLHCLFTESAVLCVSPIQKDKSFEHVCVFCVQVSGMG